MYISNDMSYGIWAGLASSDVSASALAIADW